MEDVICKWDTLSAPLNDIKVTYLRADHALRTVKIEKHALIEKVSLPQVQSIVARAERDSFQGLIEDRAVFYNKKKQEVQFKYLSNLDVKYVGIVSTILKAKSKMGGMKTSDLDPLHGTHKRRWNCRTDFVLTQGIMLSEEVSVAPLPGYCYISFEKL